jgi:hypothetical protein
MVTSRASKGNFARLLSKLRISVPINLKDSNKYMLNNEMMAFLVTM